MPSIDYFKIRTGMPDTPADDKSSSELTYFLMMSLVVGLKLNKPFGQLGKARPMLDLKLERTKFLASAIDILDGQLRLVKNSLNLLAIKLGSSKVSLLKTIDFGDLFDESDFFNLIELA